MHGIATQREAMSTYFGDTTRFDLPDGRRFTMTNNTIESTLRKWRKNYKGNLQRPFFPDITS